MIEESLDQQRATRTEARRAIHHQLSLKERQRQEREQLILQAAEDLFAENGTDEVSMDEIATRVGVAKSTVYLHFSCKEALVLALFTRDMQRFLEKIDQIAVSEQTVRAKLEAILKCSHVGLHKKQIELLTTLSNDVDIRRMLLQKNNQVHETWERFSTCVTAILDEGKKSGEIDPTLPTKILITAFLSFFASRVYRLMYEEGVSPDDLAKYMGRLYFDGVAAKQVSSEKF
jgi:TetR/AcrR family fatty acid metabolism transcriptional regulator